MRDSGSITSRIRVACLVFALLGLSSGIAQAQVVTEFTAGITGFRLQYITAGPDGNLWYTAPDSGKIGRITPLGVVTEFSAGVFPVGITAGPDGNVWFTDPRSTQTFGLIPRIGRITPLGVV